MLIINCDQLKKTMRPKALISTEANQLANELIIEYGISNDCEIAEFLGVNSVFNAQKAVRMWVQKMLPLLDKDELPQERYRQLRHLFQQRVPDFM